MHVTCTAQGMLGAACSASVCVAGSLETRKQHLWQMNTVGRCPTPAAARWSMSCPTVPHSGNDSPCA